MSGGTPGKGTFQPDSHVHITFEDQQKINRFARHNAKLVDIMYELKGKSYDMKNLEEACDEVSLMDDDSGTIPFLTGEVFVMQNVDEINKSLEEAKTKKTAEILDLESEAAALRNQMSELKAHLYGRFGSHINLENEDD